MAKAMTRMPCEATRSTAPNSRCRRAVSMLRSREDELHEREHKSNICSGAPRRKVMTSLASAEDSLGRGNFHLKEVTRRAAAVGISSKTTDLRWRAKMSNSTRPWDDDDLGDDGAVARPDFGDEGPVAIDDELDEATGGILGGGAAAGADEGGRFRGGSGRRDEEEEVVERRRYSALERKARMTARSKGSVEWGRGPSSSGPEPWQATTTSPATSRFSTDEKAHASRRCWREDCGTGLRRDRTGSRSPSPDNTESSTSLFSVMVPVLSDTRVVIPPRASAVRIRFTSTRCLDRRCAPSDNTLVMIIGSSSGMVAKPSTRPVSTAFFQWAGSCQALSAATPMATSTATTVRYLASSFTPFCSDVLGSLACRTSPTIFPASVERPVATTTATPRPEVTTVRANTMLQRAERGVDEVQRVSAVLGAGADSPVRLDSSTCKFLLSTSRASAPTQLPALRTSTSPGTRLVTSTIASFPKRRTVATGGQSCFSVFTAFLALNSFTTSVKTVTMMTTKMMIESNIDSPPCTNA
mmetsp:Transcript_21048/g.34760  ORF Transcript_21048/g.34760 Transcript_21048/m.34760 type:complete len:526 (+) Transcript_21048:1660-3237(+)